MTIISSRRLSAFAFAAFLSAATGIATPAFAIENEVDCRTKISETSQALLKANVSAEQLAQIDSEIQSAEGLCTNGDFSTAEMRLNEAMEKINAARKN